MYQHTEIYSCDVCGVPGLEREFSQLHAPLTPEERSALRAEMEIRAREHQQQMPTFMRSMLGDVAHTVKAPTGFNILFCASCLQTLLPNLPQWRAAAVTAWLENVRQRREDAAEPVER